MSNTKKNIAMKFAVVKISDGRRVVMDNSINILSLDIILGISIIISLLGIIILG
jgi:hypothetical protein